jgi:hypothetical protein
MNTYVKDLAERVAASFTGGTAAYFAVTETLDFTDPKVWLAGAVAGAVSVVKGLAAYFAAERGTASLVR